MLVLTTPQWYDRFVQREEQIAKSRAKARDNKQILAAATYCARCPLALNEGNQYMPPAGCSQNAPVCGICYGREKVNLTINTYLHFFSEVLLTSALFLIMIGLGLTNEHQ
jgi:hypothetical protein